MTATLTFVAFYVAKRAREALGASERVERVLRLVLLVSMTAPLLRFVLGSGLAVATVATVGFAVTLGAAIATALIVPVDAMSALVALLQRRGGRQGAPIGIVATSALVSTGEVEGEVAGEVEGEVAGEVEGEVAGEVEGEGAKAGTHASEPASQLVLPTRRAFLRRASIATALAVGGGTSLYGVTRGRHDYVLEQVPIRLARLPRALDGYTIAQVSDVHIGTFVGDYELAAGRDILARARPDLIVLTGDLVDHDPRYLPQLGRAIRRIVDLAPRDGVVAILGNHDYYTGADETAELLRRAGVRVLRNDAMSIGDAGARFALLGVDDVWATRNGYDGRTDLPAAIAAAEPDLARVLLCHNPELFVDAAEHVDLQLSGHTHGGQVNFFVHPIEIALPHGYIAGRYTRGDSQIYVNRGFGTAGPPARVQTPPEVTRIVLTTA